jgi:hypothetical protein
VVAVAPILLLVAVAVDPRLRHWWRGSPPGSTAGAWLIAVSVMLGILLLAVGTYRSEPLEGFGSGYPYVDMPFHIALAAELKHHVPFTTPYVHDIPLQYHWYSHAHIAATNWAAGVKIEVIVRRIVPVTMMIRRRARHRRTAARFLRSHSAPDDLVATNAHCRIPQKGRCDFRAFWLAGWSEQRVLLEGWAYTARANTATDSAGALAGQYWDAQLKAENDAVFTDPSAATAAMLKQKYGNCQRAPSS